MITLNKKFRYMSGCAYGLRQPVLLCEISIEQGARFDFDDFLANLVFEATGNHVWNLYKPQKGLEYVLSWLQKIQYYAGLPVFETGVILEQKQNTYKLALPYFHPKATANTLNWLATVLNELITNGQVQDNTKSNIIEGIKSFTQIAPYGLNPIYFLQAAHHHKIAWKKVGGDIFEFGYGFKSRWLKSSFTDHTSTLGASLARNKYQTSLLLKRAGLPVPEHGFAFSPEQAAQIAAELGYPVVVKPNELEGGVGVSANVKDESFFRKVYTRAKEKAQQILIEKHHEGNDYRLTVFEGQMLWAIQRIPGGVTGDGEQTIQELVDELNQDPRRGTASNSPLTVLEINDVALEVLAQEGLNLSSVPEKDRFVPLRNVANVDAGGTPVAVTDIVHPDNKLLAQKAAAVLRLDFAGVDVLTPDISRSWKEIGAVICEVNAQPGLHVSTAPHLFGEILQKMLQGNGRIPIILIVGHALAFKVAKTISSKIKADIAKFSKALSLLTDPETRAAVIVATPEEITKKGLPFDFCDLMVLCEAEDKNAKQLYKMVLPHVKGPVVANQKCPPSKGLIYVSSEKLGETAFRKLSCA